MRNVLRAFSFISLGGLLVGYIIGITSNVIAAGQLLCHENQAIAHDATFFLQLQPALTQSQINSDAVKDWESLASSGPGYDQCWDLTAWSRGFFTASSLIGATLSSLYCFRYSDRLGRRLEVQISASLFFLGAVVAAASPYLWGVAAGFMTYGLGIGFAMHVGAAYIGEIAPPHIRGTLIAAKEGLIVSGILLGFLSGWAFSGIEPWGWRLMTVGPAIFASVMGLGMCWIPESPRWLELHGFSEAALASMQFFREDKSLEEVRIEVAAIREDITGAEKSNSVLDYPRPMLIGCGLVFLQQVTGQPSVLYFSTSIFKALGFGSSSAFSSVTIGLVKLIATLFAIVQVDRYGRRFLLFTGIGMMAVALIAISVSISFLTCNVDGIDVAGVMNCPGANVNMPRAPSIVLVLALMLYVSGYQVGFGPIAWIMIAEVFPLQVRSSAVSVAVVINFVTNIAVTATQPALLNSWGPSGLFSVYTALTITSFFFVWYIVPETRGKTLEEITAELSPSK